MDSSRDSSRIVLRGPLFVSSKSLNDEWHCTALNFDILGIGTTKEDAFQQMKELIEVYLEDVAIELNNGNQVDFYNPSDAAEWNQGDIEVYKVICDVAKYQVVPLHELLFEDLGEVANKINAVDLRLLEPLAV